MPDLDEQRRVLVILGRDGSRWGFPGGREDGERYEDAAVREVHEETGIDRAIAGRFLLRETVTVAPSSDERPYTPWIFFDAACAAGHVDIAR